MSTVGFGDLSPRSDFERLFCSLMLMFGVAIFSYIMGEFISILEKYQAITQDIEDNQRLAKFFVLIKHFNKGKPIKNNFKLEIERYFRHKWLKDHN